MAAIPILRKCRPEIERKKKKEACLTFAGGEGAAWKEKKTADSFISSYRGKKREKGGRRKRKR